MSSTYSVEAKKNWVFLLICIFNKIRISLLRKTRFLLAPICHVSKNVMIASYGV